MGTRGRGPRRPGPARGMASRPGPEVRGPPVPALHPGRRRDQEGHHHQPRRAPRPTDRRTGPRDPLRRQPRHRPDRRIPGRAQGRIQASQREDGHIPRPARRGPDIQLFGRDLLPMPVRQHHPPLPHLPRRMPRHAIALLPRRVRQRGTHPQLRQAHRHNPLAQGQRQHHPPDHRPAQDDVQGLVGDHRRQLRLGAVPRRQRAVHH